ncbi:FAD-dependent monooxygenase [Streptomyces sp. CA-250714]|uniref:FAD-dependent monooxygenase n=1 Tax=Streptomyces sp. CA-250714 TaxID=3240060 RepID=UPI003D8FD1D2
MTGSGPCVGRALVVGMGVSGIATAARLRRAGWRPVLVERAPARRSGGYFIVLFGAGRAAAVRLGMLDPVHDRGTTTQKLDIERDGSSRPGMSFSDLPGNPWTMLRGDIEAAAFAVLPDDVETRYSTVPTAIDQDADGVDVTLLDLATEASVTERFDLVVGADGLRSTVRALAFGPHENYLRPLNYMVAAFQFHGTPAGLEPGQAVTLLEPGRSMWVFAYRDHDPTVMMTYRTDDVDAEFLRPPVARLRSVFGPQPLGSTLGDVMDAAETADELLFDSVEQVRMDKWHEGRVVLVGDAAWCVTFYAGMGVSSGLTGAELLGSMLERHPGDVGAALAAWERALRPYVDHYLDGAFADRRVFVVNSRLEILFRRMVPRLRRFRLGKRLVDRVVRIDEIARYKNPDIVGEVTGSSLQSTSESAKTVRWLSVATTGARLGMPGARGPWSRAEVVSLPAQGRLRAAMSPAASEAPSGAPPVRVPSRTILATITAVTPAGMSAMGPDTVGPEPATAAMLPTSQDCDQPATRPVSGVPKVTNQPSADSRRAAVPVNGSGCPAALSSREKSSNARALNSNQGSPSPSPAARWAVDGLSWHRSVVLLEACTSLPIGRLSRASEALRQKSVCTQTAPSSNIRMTPMPAKASPTSSASARDA